MKMFARREASLLCAMLVASAAASEELIPRDAEAAAAIIAQAAFWSASVEHCRQYVPEELHPRIDEVWQSWQSVNFDYVDIARIIRGQMLELIGDRHGSASALELNTQFTEDVERGKANAREIIDALPEDRREEKCYGILGSILQGEQDIPVTLPEDAAHIEARVEVMNW